MNEKCIWTKYANNKTMRIVLKFKVFHCIWFIGNEQIMFHFYFERKNGKDLTLRVSIFNKHHEELRGNMV